MTKVIQALRFFYSAYRERQRIQTFLKYCREYEQASGRTLNPGGTTSEDLEHLKALVEIANGLPGPIVEIGVLFGFTTQRLAQWKLEDKELIGVDNFGWNPIGIPPSAHRELTFQSLSYLMQKNNVKLFDGHNVDFYDTLDVAPSMVFIDAGHSYEGVKVDIDWAFTRGVPIISGHDYSEHHPGVVKAVHEYFGDKVQVRGSVWAYLNVPDAVPSLT